MGYLLFPAISIMASLVQIIFAKKISLVRFLRVMIFPNAFFILMQLIGLITELFRGDAYRSYVVFEIWLVPFLLSPTLAIALSIFAIFRRRAIGKSIEENNLKPGL